MAEGNDRNQKTSWLFQQAEQEVKDAQKALKQAETSQAKNAARRLLQEAQDRLKSLRKAEQAYREANRGARQAAESVAEAEAAVKAAAETPDPQDDIEAAAALRDAQRREERRTTARDEAQQGRRDTRQEAAASFYEDLGPFAAEIIKEYPQLRELFRRAVEEGWQPDKFQQEMFSPNRPWSEWISKKGQYWQTGFKLQYQTSTTTAAWDEKLKEAGRIIQAAAKDAGVSLSPEQLARLSQRYWYSEWQANPDALVSWMQQRATNPNQELVTDESGAPVVAPSLDSKITELADLAESYGLSIDKAVLTDWARKILDPMVNTNKSEDARFLQWIVGESKSRYGTYADQIDENTNLRQLTGTYTSTLARLLEMNPADLKLDENNMDPLLKKALTNINLETGLPERVPLWKFEQMVRQDDRWQLTDNARQTYMNAGTGFLRALGFVG